MNVRFAPNTMQSQTGAVLVVGLVFLALLSLMGATAYSIATQEERMAGNTRDKIRAFEAAEAALRTCEAQLVAATLPTFTTAGTGGYFSKDAVPIDQGNPPVHANPGFFSWSNTGTVREATGMSSELAITPRCIVEQFSEQEDLSGSLRTGLPRAPGYTPYLITARGVGSNPGTQVILQSTLVRSD